jgi:phospholipid/cholesterol/gamma-HCH transport system permease protein
MNFFLHFGKYILMLKGMFTKPESSKMYWKEFMKQCVDIGIRSLPIVIIISVFLGSVTTVQTAYQLVNPLIPASTISQIVRDSMILELSPTVLCIVLAGVVGSRIASELGNMSISEQIDAIEVMGINTKAFLIRPKIVAAIVTIPLLVILSISLGIWGGRTAGALSGIITTTDFDKGLLESFDVYNLKFAMVKAYTFSFIIASIPAYFGYHVKGGALEIGQSSTTAVVTSCILILLADYGLAALLLKK